MEQIKLENFPYAKIFKIPKTEIDKIDFALCNQPTETIDKYYNRQEKKPDIICNGGFFAMSTGNTVFHYVDEHTVISTDKSLLDGVGITPWSNQMIFFGEYINEYKDFISAYPMLMRHGTEVITSVGKELDYNARRTILADNDTDIFLIFVDSYGYNFTKCKQLLKELGALNAANLDGGGSTRALLKGNLITSDAVYNRPVDNVVCFYLKEKVIYRVQTGAFKDKENAENYRNKIRWLQDDISAGYKNAYIRYINGLYKVQVGAFSNRSNAEKVIKNLKEKGFNAFITVE